MFDRRLSSPNYFLKKFCMAAILSSLALLVLSSLVSYELYKGYVLRLAESNATSLAASMVTKHRDVLESTLKSPLLTTHEFTKLDHTLRAFIEPYGVIKVKLFAPTRAIVYSTDKSIIGRVDKGNSHLHKALSGGNSSNIQTKDQFHDLANEKRFNVDVVESYVPVLTIRGDLIGVFEIYQDMTQFRPEITRGVLLFSVSLFVILCLVFSVAFYFVKKSASKMINQQQILEQLATIDVVTNTYNRAEIYRKMNAEWERYKRSGDDTNGFGLIMLDLDHFKSVNDSYGHQTGDKLLKRVGALLQKELRLYSDVGRYGGEEFMVLVPEVTLTGLEGIASRVLKLISSERFNISGNNIPLTISAGIAIATKQDLSLDEVVKRADNNLYIAKEAGRNCVHGACEEALI